LAETINGLYTAELIHRLAPWKTKKAVELATLEYPNTWVCAISQDGSWRHRGHSNRRIEELLQHRWHKPCA